MSHTLQRMIAAATVICLSSCSTDAASPASLGSVVLISGDAQLGTPGQPLADTLRAQVLTVTGRPMSGVSVQWTVSYGGGAVSAHSDASDANGNVSAVLTLGAVPGQNQVIVTAADLPGAVFTATGRGFQALKVWVGVEHACALDLHGRTWCWGASRIRGDSTDSLDSYMPTLVAGGHHFVEVAAGDDFSCAIESDGSSWCWGRGGIGDLGQGVYSSTATYPVRVINAPPFTHIAAGPDPGYFACGLTADGSAFCWGDDLVGELGDGATDTFATTPQAVVGGHHFSAISVGESHVCGVATDSTAWCWGQGGMLGDSDTQDSPSTIPVAVHGGHRFRTLTAGAGLTCGDTFDAGFLCWGYPYQEGAPLRVPMPIPEYSRFAAFAPGGARSVGLSQSSVYEVFEPDEIQPLGSPVYLHSPAAGFLTGCGLAPDATVYCWGANEAGQAGAPNPIDSGLGQASVHAVVVPANY